MGAKRDPRYSRTVRRPPHTGRRYVSGGKVRIEWTERGHRRTRTIGPNSAAARRDADRILEEVLKTMHDDTDADASTNDGPSADIELEFPDVIRRAALAVTDAADTVADWLEESFRRMWHIPSDPDVEVSDDATDPDQSPREAAPPHPPGDTR